MKSCAEQVRQAQSRDHRESHRAFDCLVRDYRGMVYAIAHARVSDSQLAEDIVQEAFITAWKRLAQLRDAGAFPAWLRRIALTHADRIHRAERAADIFEDHRQDSADNPETRLEERQLRERVRAAVAALPDSQRDVTDDFYLKGQSQREISERMGLPLATVKKRLQYARAQLRGMLAGINEGIDRAFMPKDPPEMQPVRVIERRNRDRRA